MSDNHTTSLFLSLYGRDKREGCIVITGTISADKTTMCRMVLRKVESESRSEFPLNRYLYENELLGSILQNFGILGKSTKKRTKKKKIYQLIQFLLKTLNGGEFALLVVEDEHNLPLTGSDQEKIASDLEVKNEKFLQIMLIGKGVDGQDLKSLKLEQFYNNEKCMYQLSRDPLKLDEIQKYIEHRLMIAGPVVDIQFSPEALTYIQKHPLGIPCIRNLIFDCELTDTYTQQTIETNVECIENTVQNDTFQEGDRLTFERSYVGTTWMSKMRQVVLIPAVAVILLSAGTIGFFISHSVFTKNTPAYKAEQRKANLQRQVADTIDAPEETGQPKQNLLYSYNMMAQKKRGHAPAQKLPDIQGPVAKIPPALGKKEQFKRAIEYQKNGKLVKAEGEYMELLKLYPNDYEIHNNLGSVYQELGNFDNAIIEYRKAINLNPNYSMARNNLGIALYQKGDLKAAIEEFKIILEANPKDVRCITHLGVLSKKLNHPERARRFFEEALSIDPTYPEAHYNLAVILEEYDVNKAAFHFQKFLDCGTGSKYRFLEKEVMKRLENMYKSSSS